MIDYQLIGYRWPSATITYSFASTTYGTDVGLFNISHYIDGIYREPIYRAMREWEAATGLHFEQKFDPLLPAGATGVLPVDPIDIRFAFDRLGLAKTGEVGVTAFRGDANGLFVPTVNVRFEDPAEFPVTTVNGELTYRNTVATLYQLALHEIGHALGLEHSASPSDVLYPFVTGGNFKLTESDIAGVRALYPGAFHPVRPPTRPDLTVLGNHGDYVIAKLGSGQIYIRDTVDGRDGTRVLASAGRLHFADGDGQFDPTGATEDVTRLYRAAFGRTPDLPGLDDNVALIDSRTIGFQGMAASFAASPEFLQTYGATSATEFVNLMYRNVLNRVPDLSEVQVWLRALATGSRGDVLLSFADSTENHIRTLPVAGSQNDAAATRLYMAAFIRAPDGPGLTKWSGQLQAGASIDTVAQGFTDSAEFRQNYGASLSNTGFVTQLYKNVLHRAPDAPGQQVWLNALGAGFTRGHVLAGFSESDENRIATAAVTHDAWVFVA